MVFEKGSNLLLTLNHFPLESRADLIPFTNCQHLKVGSGDQNIISILEKAMGAAREGSDKTVELVARKGRASYLGDRSKGHKDPGSVYIVLMFEAALERLQSTPGQ